MSLSWFGPRDPFVVLDEGGVRIREPNTRYVPFGKLRAVRVEYAFRPRLFFSTEDEVEIEAILPLSWEDGASPTHLCKTIEQHRDAAHATSARMAATRGDIGSWIAMVSASSAVDRGGAFYRASFCDVELLDRTLADPTDAIEARAASAHALLARDRTDLVAPRIGPSSPPLVVAAARLGRGGDRIVSTSLLDEILPFLELRDRVVFTQRARTHVADDNDDDDDDDDRSRVA